MKIKNKNLRMVFMAIIIAVGVVISPILRVEGMGTDGGAGAAGGVDAGMGARTGVGTGARTRVGAEGGTGAWIRAKGGAETGTERGYQSAAF